MQCAIWILIEPDNGHYDSKYALETVMDLADTYGVKIWRTYRTRDTGFGQEEKFVIEGANIQEFENAVNEELY